jgi:hypothetical protein
MDETRIERINTSAQIREKASRSVIEVFRNYDVLSEKGYAARLSRALSLNGEVHSKGWYEPPPDGVALLFGGEQKMDRLLFDTLRREQFWPRDDIFLDSETVVILYVSPFHRKTGTIGDFGLTLYRGKRLDVRQHMARCLRIVEDVVGYAEAGMEFCDLFHRGQELFRSEGVNNQRTTALTNPVGTVGLGHTIPWSYETDSSGPAFPDALVYEESKRLISTGRRYISASENFVIPRTIAFTVEARLEDSNDPSLPNIFFHYIVSFVDGEKRVHADFRPVFQALGMGEFLDSRY